MVKCTETWKVPVPADEAWALMGDFNGLASVSPDVEKSELEQGGAIRRLTLTDGAQFIEQLVSYDEDARQVAYAILEGIGMELPFDRYVGTYRVIEDVPGQSCIFELVGEYDGEGFTEADVLDDMHGFYDGCMEGLVKAHNG
jgi:hypothetical protein